MKFINVREFSSTVTKSLEKTLKRAKKVVITRRGKPVTSRNV
jgi:hypothetical protein